MVSRAAIAHDVGASQKLESANTATLEFGSVISE